MKWAGLYRQYLALRKEEDFEASISEAPDEIAEFLGVCLESDHEQAADALGPLLATLADAKNGEEGMTVRLAYLDLSVEYCESFRQLDPSAWDDALRHGIAACREAIDLSTRLNDSPCVAFYASLIAAGFRNSGATERAILPQLQALEIYRSLAKDNPSQYRSEVAITLSNLANAYCDLPDLGAALRAFEEAVAIYQELADSEPEHYLRLLAGTLNNFATMLDDLRELTRSRDMHLEALAIYRSLADQEPTAYRPDVATSLSNLGTVLRDLHDLHRGREATEEALALYRHLAEDQPGIYRAEIATALLNLGNILQELREPALAREAIQEALDIFRELAEVRPESYRADIANALAALGNVLDELLEPAGSREAFADALAIYRELDAAQPGVYLPDVARVLHNLCVTLRALREFSSAREAAEECLAIRRKLAKTLPTVYRPDIADTLNNLGVVLSAMRDLIASRQAHEEALEIYRELAAAEPEVYLPEVGMMLMNLGGVMLELRELAAARDVSREALAIRRRLAETDPAVYLPEMAAILNNLGVIFVDLHELPQGRDAHQEALKIRRSLATIERDIYLPEVATSLSNLGNVLSLLGESSDARKANDEALRLRRNLAERQPAVYLPVVAETLINLSAMLREDDELALADAAARDALGIAQVLASTEPDIYLPLVANARNHLGAILRGLGQLDAAREAFREARDLYLSGALWGDAALPAANLGRLEMEAGAPGVAEEQFERALEYLHTGLRQLGGSEHHDKFKSWIEDAATGLIEIHATAPDSESRCLRVAGLFESLRRHDLLGEEEGGAASLLRNIATGRGPLAEALKACRAAFLWIQAAENVVVFGIVRPGRAAIVRTAPKGWMAQFEIALDQVRGLINSSELSALIRDPESYRGSGPDRTIHRLMRDAFQLLPADVQDLLTDPEVETLFVSPCRLTLQFPIELLPANGICVGLRKVLVRVQALQDLPALLEREPDLSKGSRFVFGDPDTGVLTVDRLPHALAAARELAGFLKATQLAPEAAFADRATRAAVLQALQDTALVLFIFSGHGSEGSLMLAGGERVSAADLDGQEWTMAPFVHLDCCSAGSSRGRGGGRFEGMPPGCLLSGASAVLASSQLLYETSSVEFGQVLYTALLEEGATLGEALLRARRTIDDRYGGNPLLWVTSVLWGNPCVRLIPKKIG